MTGTWQGKRMSRSGAHYNHQQLKFVGEEVKKLLLFVFRVTNSGKIFNNSSCIIHYLNYLEDLIYSNPHPPTQANNQMLKRVSK